MRLADHALAFTEGQRAWRIAALAMLSTRIIQGFIYWGGGSRRFIYAPAQLNPDAPTWTSVPCRIISTASIRVRDGLAG
jgi:thiosulfate dehydrogenase (quinone)